MEKNVMTVKRIGMLGVFFVILALTIYAQEPSQEDQQKMMEAYMKMSALNENHEHLKIFAGDWEVSTKGWMYPGAEPALSQGISKGGMIMGGRFLKMHFKGTMFGQPFECLQIIGYDNLQKKYVTFWIDSTSTAFYLMSGTRDKEKNVTTEAGVWPDPMTGGTIKVRDVTELISKDEFKYEMYMTGPDGKEFKIVEYIAKRKK
jgi:hypothetical protein